MFVWRPYQVLFFLVVLVVSRIEHQRNIADWCQAKHRNNLCDLVYNFLQYYKRIFSYSICLSNYNYTYFFSWALLRKWRTTAFIAMTIMINPISPPITDTIIIVSVLSTSLTVGQSNKRKTHYTLRYYQYFIKKYCNSNGS